MGEHSKYSASGFEAMRSCPGKLFMEKGLPDKPGPAAAAGTAKHRVLEQLLTPGNLNPGGVCLTLPHSTNIDGFEVETTEDHIEELRQVAENIRGMSMDGAVYPEQRVNYARYLGVPKEEAWGTLDAATLPRPRALAVHDLKTGYRAVDPLCDQMKLYALGGIDLFSLTDGPFDEVDLVIHQPAISSKPIVATLTVKELQDWAATIGQDAVEAEQEAHRAAYSGQEGWGEKHLNPGKACDYCRAKTTCQALRNDVIKTTFSVVPATAEDFAPVKTSAEHVKVADNDWLDAVLLKADMIESFVTAVRAEAFARMSNGVKFRSHKLVQGKRGNRAWKDKAAAEKKLREQFRLPIDKAYDLKLISPTTAEKLHKDGTIGPRQWLELQEMYEQADGKPSVALATDKRPALDIRPIAESFPILPDNSDLV